MKAFYLFEFPILILAAKVRSLQTEYEAYKVVVKKFRKCKFEKG